MKRIWRHLLIFFVMLAVLCTIGTVFWFVAKSKKGRETDKLSENVTTEIGTEWYAESTEATSADYMERYGIPKQGFIEVCLSDPDHVIDFETIHTLLCYKAKPMYSSEELIERMANYFWDGRSYTSGKQDADFSTSGKLKGWGYLYTCTDEETGERLNGNNYAVSLTTKSPGRELENFKEFAEKTCSALHLGIWKDGENLLHPVGGEFVNLNVTLEGELDGLPILFDLTGGSDQEHQSDANYLGGVPTFYNHNGNLEGIERVFCAEIIRGMELPYAYRDLEDLEEAIRTSCYNPSDSGQILEFRPIGIGYAVGETEEVEFLLTPWIVFEGDYSVFTEEGSWWVLHHYQMALNLNSGQVYFFGDRHINLPSISEGNYVK